MRKLMPLFIFLFVLFPSCSATLPERLPEVNEEPSFSWYLFSLRDIDHFSTTLSRFSYQREQGDYWKSPAEFFQDGGGDCEDWAYFTAYVLLRKDWVYRSYVVIVATKWLRLHALGIGEDSSSFFVFDCWMLHRFSKSETKAINDAVKLAGYIPLRIYQVPLPREKKSQKKPNYCPLDGECY